MLRRIAIVLALAGGAAGAQTWEVLPSLPTGGAARTSAFAATLNGRVYVLGGMPWTSGGDGSVHSIALGGASWTEEASFDGIGPIVGQGGGVGSLGRIVVFGGEDTDNPGDSGPTFDWTPSEGPWHDLAARGASAPMKAFASCTDASGRVYSFGGGAGENATASATNSNYAERYLANSDSWQVIAAMPVAAGDAAAVDDGMGHILVIGGVSANGSTRLTEVQQFDVASGTWSTTATPDLPAPVSAARAVRGANGKVYLIGGRDGPVRSGSTRNEVLVYDPATNAWSDGPSMMTPRREFAAVLGADEYIYVMGGANETGGTNAAERIRPSSCPVFNAGPSDATVWQGSPVWLAAQVVGDGPLSLHWEREGEVVVDGDTAHGSVISGATSETLTISNAQPEDEGLYELIATNSCGTTTSDAAMVAVRAVPAIPTQWTVTNLHPAYAQSSRALDVDGDTQVGDAIFDTPEYNGIDHPTIWHGSAASAINATPAGSQGGVISAIAGDALVGWWWRPFDCYVGGQWLPCYYQRASVWDGSGVHRYPTATGWEYHSIADTNGTWHVGTSSRDDDVGNITQHATVWVEPDLWPMDLHPAGVSHSALTAIDGDNQYGWIHTPYPGPVQHAAMWSGSAATFVDLHPAGAARSAVNGAGDGQQVGTINFFNDRKAGIWSNSAASFLLLHPTGAGVSEANACEQGMQVGTVDGAAHLWANSADGGLDLGAIAGAGYTSTAAYGIDVTPQGVVTIVGSGYNAATGRQEALMWQSVSTCGVADLAEPYGVLDFFDVAAYLAAFSAQEPSADLTGDGVFDFFDVSAFLGAFSAGCP